MKIGLILWTILVLGLGAASLAYADQSETESKKANISGDYNVTFTTEQGQQQTAQIMIEDLKNGKVQASGDYKGYPVSMVGDLTGDVAKEGAVCNFDINKPGLVTGKAEITIQLAGGGFQLQGQFAGSYSYLGNSGETSGRVQGNRMESAAISKSSSLRTAASITGACLIAGLTYVVWRRRVKKVRS